MMTSKRTVKGMMNVLYDIRNMHRALAEVEADKDLIKQLLARIEVAPTREESKRLTECVQIMQDDLFGAKEEYDKLYKSLEKTGVKIEINDKFHESA
jgi:hypothetical protein